VDLKGLRGGGTLLVGSEALLDNAPHDLDDDHTTTDSGAGSGGGSGGSSGGGSEGEVATAPLTPAQREYAAKLRGERGGTVVVWAALVGPSQPSSSAPSSASAASGRSSARAAAPLVAACLGLTDPIRPESRAVVAALQVRPSPATAPMQAPIYPI